jgi:hypothetical protein
MVEESKLAIRSPTQRRKMRQWDSNRDLFFVE